MANFASSDVTYTVMNQRTLQDSRKFNKIKLQFGDGALTYAAGGIPLLIGSMGCPVVVESAIIVDNGNSIYELSYDSTNKKLLMYSGSTHTHDIKALGGLTSSEALLLDSSQSFGKNAATNRTIVGSTSANTGGVVAAVPAAANAEITGTAPAAQTVMLEVIGY